MKLHYHLSGGQTFIKKFPLYDAGTVIPEGAAVVKGATPGTNQGFGIVAPAACAGVLGVTAQQDPIVVTQTDSKQDGTVYTRYKVIVNPDAVYLCELSLPATAAIAIASVSAATAGATVTVTSLEDDIDGGWLWGSDGVIQWIATSASGSCTIKSANAWTAATTLSRLLPLFKILQDLDATAVKLKPAAAIGTGKIITLENYVQTKPNARIETLDPTKHSGLTVDVTYGKLFADIIFQNHAFANIGAS